MTVKRQLQTILSLIIVLSNTAYSQNYDREAKHAESIEETLIIGDSVYLSSPEEPDHQFISLLTEAASDNKTAIIIVHGSGIHPNWADLIHPLRANLPDLGYTTLAIQMPVPSLNADYNAYPSLFPLAKSRLETAQDYLLAKGYENIYIIAHSMGAGMSSWSLAQSNKLIKAIKGVVLIGSVDLRDYGLDNISSIAQLNIPVADIYGSDDLPVVIDASHYRLKQGETLESFQQIIIDDANHIFSDPEAFSTLESEILTILAHWK